jgi:hypothetical protein
MNEKPSANEKGLALEGAVESIEKMIHEVRGIPPEYINIENRKVINHEGVRHEIDLYVTVKFGDGYDATYIFEAKNWKDPVGKSQIIEFIEKMRVTASQAGFFYAPSFTSCAEAQSKLYPNVHLVQVAVETECPTSCLPVVETCENRINAISINSHKKWMPLTNELLKEFRSEEVEFDLLSLLKVAQSGIVDDFQKKVDKTRQKVGPSVMVVGRFGIEGEPVIWRDEKVITVWLRIEVRYKTIGTSCKISYTAEGRGRHIHLNDVRISKNHVLTNIKTTMR